MVLRMGRRVAETGDVGCGRAERHDQSVPRATVRRRLANPEV